MLQHLQTLADLQQTCTQPGRLEWIGLRSAHRSEMRVVDAAELLEGAGVSGDYFAGRSTQGRRQVTLLQAEHLPVIAALCQRTEIDPAQLRRNLVIRGINLLTLKSRQFRLGNAILEGSGSCHPCSRMEENLGSGGYNAVRGHGGITARVIKGGIVRLGDRLEMIKHP